MPGARGRLARARTSTGRGSSRDGAAAAAPAASAHAAAQQGQMPNNPRAAQNLGELTLQWPCHPSRRKTLRGEGQESRQQDLEAWLLQYLSLEAGDWRPAPASPLDPVRALNPLHAMPLWQAAGALARWCADPPVGSRKKPLSPQRLPPHPSLAPAHRKGDRAGSHGMHPYGTHELRRRAATPSTPAHATQALSCLTATHASSPRCRFTLLLPQLAVVQNLLPSPAEPLGASQTQ